MDYPVSVPGVGLVGGKFVDEDAAVGQIGSLIPAAWGNAVTDEIVAVIEAAGLTPSEAPPRHFLPSAGGYVRACEIGMGWGMHPMAMVQEELAQGRNQSVQDIRGEIKLLARTIAAAASNER